MYTGSQSKGYTEICTRAGKISQIPKSLYLTFHVNKLNFINLNKTKRNLKRTKFDNRYKCTKKLTQDCSRNNITKSETGICY